MKKTPKISSRILDLCDEMVEELTLTLKTVFSSKKNFFKKKKSKNSEASYLDLMRTNPVQKEFLNVMREYGRTNLRAGPKKEFDFLELISEFKKTNTKYHFYLNIQNRAVQLRSRKTKTVQNLRRLDPKTICF